MNLKKLVIKLYDSGSVESSGNIISDSEPHCSTQNDDTTSHTDSVKPKKSTDIENVKKNLFD